MELRAVTNGPAAVALVDGVPAALMHAVEEVALDQILWLDAVQPLFQPIVDLDSGAIAGYEALARGPHGSVLETPATLFGAARREARVDELDWACRAAAMDAAAQAGLGPPLTVFVNVEPDQLGSFCPAHLSERIAAAQGQLSLVYEITERALTARPAELLAAVAALRGAGAGIALDDVGADTRSLALMPVLRPDVIKLDLRLVQRQPSDEIAEVVQAVNAESERTGAVVVAEGVETEAHLATAKAMGARLAQGWLLGRPAPLPASFPAPTRALSLVASPAPTGGATPFEVLARRRPVRAADKRLLLAMTRTIERQAVGVGDGAVVLSAFQTAERFTRASRELYGRLAAKSAFVAALGTGMELEPALGVRGAALEPNDPLVGEWGVVVLGPHFAAALVARDLGDAGPEMQRHFDYALSYDRDLVVGAAAALMSRVAPLG